MGFQGTVTIDKGSLKNIRATLEALPRELRKNAAAAVIRTGAKPIQTAMKAKVPVRTGQLKKSIGTKSRSLVYGSGGSVMAYAVIGPRRGFKSKTSLTGRKRKARKTNSKRKSTFIERRYAEMDEIAWYLETGTPKMPAHPFIRPAIDAAQGQCLTAMAAGFEKHMARIAARLAGKGRKR